MEPPDEVLQRAKQIFHAAQSLEKAVCGQNVEAHRVCQSGCCLLVFGSCSSFGIVRYLCLAVTGCRAATRHTKCKIGRFSRLLCRRQRLQELRPSCWSASAHRLTPDGFSCRMQGRKRAVPCITTHSEFSVRGRDCYRVNMNDQGKAADVSKSSRTERRECTVMHRRTMQTSVPADEHL